MLRYQLHKNAYFRAVVQRLATLRRFVHSPVIEKSVVVVYAVITGGVSLHVRMCRVITGGVSLHVRTCRDTPPVITACTTTNGTPIA